MPTAGRLKRGPPGASLAESIHITSLRGMGFAVSPSNIRCSGSVCWYLTQPAHTVLAEPNPDLSDSEMLLLIAWASTTNSLSSLLLCLMHTSVFLLEPCFGLGHLSISKTSLCFRLVPRVSRPLGVLRCIKVGSLSEYCDPGWTISRQQTSSGSRQDARHLYSVDVWMRSFNGATTRLLLPPDPLQ